MSPSSAADPDAICPQCRTAMVHVAVTPHPVVRNMQRNTYVCYSCKRTRTYMLPGKLEIESHVNDAAQRAS
jgi:transposase-like protein